MSIIQQETVIFLMGPTAAGKTDFALKIAERLPVEIISVDSALVYRGMDIGTAKPTAAQLAQVPHHLIDIRNPDEPYSVAQFREDALRLIREIFSRGRIPLLVGGSMLYFRALKSGLADLPSADDEIRKRLDKEMKKHGVVYLHERLQAIDPKSAERINQNDPQRVQRALEVYELSGKTLSELQDSQEDEAFPYSLIELVVAPKDRRVLHQQIAQRFHEMLQNGLVAEVEKLMAAYALNRDLPSMRAVGYRQVCDYIVGFTGYREMVQHGVTATRQLAKRQLTWLKGWEGARWCDTTDAPAVQRLLSDLTKSFTVQTQQVV